ncbi:MULTISPECIES: efflux RND transporter periplasmic adaptor subunit [Thalassospira]|uniref:Efflux transporter periplasmic adaptor subunit n=1 Tax=Thalassospira povalilytica TaxID=732237 RepID=A0ABX4RAE7_9PROT|nr:MULTISPECIES: efflux RND transporter periplasmic adaptor subunit [Thalassospira]MAL39560.1 efflux transporter periplasmic adaptor subunit [Thalassospira sp.]MCC4241511.1 efflux RND transporter periplasmic adaptor subunit [Thalassospira povalilytica]PKR50828.1 efflux transporter periplasmic adaptor subunit [Thalassospira povalilytica]|tara:strand:- start:401 stop:1411 length:1011 start_codon:yes stop_codon:yes gene_type:complete
MKNLRSVLIVLVVIVAVAGGGFAYWKSQQSELPDFIASGNGRIEAEEIRVATKYAGRVDEVLVDEGDTVSAGQVLARMDTAELMASQARARAEVAGAEQGIAEAEALIIQRQSELSFAQQQLARANELVKNNNISREQVDQRRADRDVAQAALSAAQAKLVSAQRNVEATEAELRRIQVQIDDSVLKAPRDGRVQYRLAEPGEVLSGGGPVITMIDLSDVYMNVFLPTRQAGLAFVGNEARIMLDAAPGFVIPAKVSFVADDAQFTPREVETRSERDKLMFRVKVRIDRELLAEHIKRVKTGLPGEAYIMLADHQDWPDAFTPNVPDDATLRQSMK